jgi:membrane protease YdiL (CAAX protease family)
MGQASEAESSAAARREIRLFLALTFVLSGGFYAYLLLAAEPRWEGARSAAFMWCPGISALMARLALFRTVRGLGLGWGRTWRYLPGVYLLPFLLAGIVYLSVWTLGGGSYDTERLLAVAAGMGLPSGTPGVALLATLAILGAGLGVTSTLGEELGWRGLLVPRLLTLTGFSRASLVTGLVWSVWHYPLIFVLLPRLRPMNRAFATVCFTISVTAVSFFYTWLRIRSGSVWLAALLHAASNGAQTLGEAMTTDTGPTEYLTYEYGAGFSVVLLVLLAIFGRRLARVTA